MSNLNYFNKLSDPMILLIFHKLNLKSLLNCSQVCLRFYKISHDKSLKRNINLNGNDIDIGLLRKVISFTNRDLCKLIVNCSSNDENSEDKTIISSKLFKRIYNKCTKLNYLELEHVYSFTLRIQKLPRNLNHLALRYCAFSFFSLFVKNCKNNYMSRLDKINCLDLSYSTLFDSQNCLLLNNFQYLKYLYLEGLFRINNGGLYWLETTILNNLLVLDVEGTEITCEIFMFAAKNCDNLREFYFGHTYIDSMLMQLNKDRVKSKKLTSICIYNLDLDIDSINFINDILPNLKFIYLDNRLHSKIKTQLTNQLQNKLIIKDKSDDSKTCLHFKEHKCNKYI